MYMPKNVVFLSGCHGTGKSTLKEKLLDQIPYLIRYDKCEMTSFEDIFERQIRRITKYRIDHERIAKLALDNPDKIILTDRCVFDAIVYIDAFSTLGWLDNSDTITCKHMIDVLFPSAKYYPKNVILIHPSLDTIKEFLSKRQSEEGTKWNENNEYYLSMVYHYYNYKFNNQNMQYSQNKYTKNINFLKLEAVDLDERVKKCKHYLDNLYNEIKN